MAISVDTLRVFRLRRIFAVTRKKHTLRLSMYEGAHENKKEKTDGPLNLIRKY